MNFRQHLLPHSLLAYKVFFSLVGNNIFCFSTLEFCFSLNNKRFGTLSLAVDKLLFSKSPNKISSKHRQYWLFICCWNFPKGLKKPKKKYLLICIPDRMSCFDARKNSKYQTSK